MKFTGVERDNEIRNAYIFWIGSLLIYIPHWPWCTFIELGLTSALLQVFKKKKKSNLNNVPIPLAARSKALVRGRSFAGIPVSNPAAGMDVYLLWVLCLVMYRSQRADHPSRGVLATVVDLTEFDYESSVMRRSCPTRAVAPWYS